MQNFARQHSISIDTLSFDFLVQPNSQIDSEAQLEDVKLQMDIKKIAFQVHT